jgi:hypothetical protein
MTDKEVMQMALDALECWQRNVDCSEPMSKILEALRAALAQPERAECDGGQCGIGGYCKECPKTQFDKEWVGLTDEDICGVLVNLQEMYNRPPTTDSRVIFARAIEAKLKEKNT